MTQQLAAGLVPEWTLGDRLRKARELTGLDAVEFADEILVHRDTVANYEKGKIHRPRAMVLNAWALRTGVSLQWLKDGSAGNSPHPTYRSAGGGDMVANAKGSETDIPGYSAARFELQDGFAGVCAAA